MLGRLVRHDMRAISKRAVPLFIASGIVSLLCCAVIYFTFGFADGIDSIFNAFMLTGGLSMICVGTIIAMFVSVLILVVARYYRSVFSDEGYLFMTVPVKKKTFLNAKVISSFIWFLLAAAVAWASAFISLVLPVLLYDTSLVSNVFELIKKEMGLTEVDTVYSLTAFAVRIIIAAASIVKDVMLIIASITLGAVMIKRFKMPFAILVYFLISFTDELLIDTVSALVHWITVDQKWLTLLINSVFELDMIAIVYIAAYIGTNFILEKKLNLP